MIRCRLNSKCLDFGLRSPIIIRLSILTLFRAFWFALGMVTLVLGILGIFLPLLPTTVFILIAAFCFARSSDALHDWLIYHPRFGPPILSWREHRTVSRKAKKYAVAALAVSIFVTFVIGASATVIWAQAVVLSGVALFLLSRPEPPN